MNTLKTRLKAFAWHAGTMALVVVLNELAKNLGTLGLNESTIIILGLVLAQVTKYLNTKV